MSDWGPVPRVAVNVGDTLLTPHGEERVLSIDYAADWIITPTGTWRFEELEALPKPDVSDVDSVETWLRIAGVIIPRLEVQSRTVNCSCDCSACYRVDMWEAPSEQGGIVQNFRSSHFRNNTTCSCEKEACPCRS